MEQPKNIPDTKIVQSKEIPPSLEVLRYEGESQAAYLHRTEDAVTKKLEKEKGLLFDPSRSTEEELSPEIKTLIAAIAENAKLSYDDRNAKQNIDEVLKTVSDSIGGHSKLQGDEFSSDSFDTTQRSRKFFEIQPGKGSAKRETYWNTLFFQYNTEETRGLAKGMLNGKEIILFGGGRSKLKKELEEYDIHPAHILNIDPFVENPEKDADHVISLNACSDNLIESLNISADEIWAEYSVPSYVGDPQEIKQLIFNIDGLLKQGGTARIWPLDVGRGTSDEQFEACKTALAESIRTICSDNKYEVSLYKSAGRNGLILYKKNTSIKNCNYSGFFAK
ncbi:MAG: hypothetical protein U9M94_01320 [Patescibacteria group bacterium]|nr:hypothetical protein [Patescibacteria group bacterium]